MENLKELVHIVNRNKVKRIDMLDLQDDSPSKVNALYKAISEGTVVDDEAAFELLFPDARSRSAYINLKTTLKEKLLNTLFFIDAYQPGHSDRQTAFYECHKEFAAAQLLLAKNARRTAVDILERLLKKAILFEFSDLVLATVRLLRLHYGTRLGMADKYREYNDLWKDYHHLDGLENLAEQYYTDLVIHYVNQTLTREQLQQLAKVYLEELTPALATTTAYKYHLYTALVRRLEHSCVNDYQRTIPVCDEIIAFFEQKPFESNTPIQICLHHQLVGYMQMRDYANGKRVALRSKDLLEPGAFNWFKNLEYLFLLAMHTANYQDAYHLFREAVTHKRYEFLSEHIQELWQLYQAYVHLLIDTGHILPDDDDRLFTAFRIKRFLNSMPIYSKDKRGMNIAILVVQILFLIQQGQHDTAVDRIEAVEKYCSRYLFKAETLRSYYFIHLLLTIPQAGFNRIAVERHAKKHIAKLASIPSEISSQYHKIEIIPYEQLWDMAVTMLDAKTQKMARSRTTAAKQS